MSFAHQSCSKGDKGDKGDTGAQGPEGDPGPPGEMVQHGYEYHQGRIVDAAASLPGSAADGELFYHTDLKHLYLYQT